MEADAKGAKRGFAGRRGLGLPAFFAFFFFFATIFALLLGSEPARIVTSVERSDNRRST
jgi:hypothetical protein